MLPRQEINNLEYQVNFIDFYYNNSKNINKPPLEFIRNFSPNSDSDKIYDIKIIPICVVDVKGNQGQDFIINLAKEQLGDYKKIGSEINLMYSFINGN